MKSPYWWSEAEREADPIIGEFVAKLRDKLAVPPEKILMRKNPFLYRVRVKSDADELVKMIIDAYLSSSEETLFGTVLEQVAISVCRHAKGGRKSSTEEIDLEYGDDDKRTLIQIKSGVNWGNSSQHKAQRDAFSRARRILRQGHANLHVRCIEGCCYGKSEIRDRGTHEKIVGNEFWKEISGWDGTAGAVLGLIGRHAANGLTDARTKAQEQMIEFLRREGVADSDGIISWDRLLALIMRPARSRTHS